MNDMKCEVVKDLLPVYMDDLVSEVTKQEVEQHLQQCESCNAIYQQMKAPIDNTDMVPNDKEINYLKKLRKKGLINIITCIVAMSVIFTILTSLFAIGASVKQQDMTYTYSIENSILWIHFELTNGKKLLMRTDRTPIYNENNESIGFDHILTPCQVFNNPFDDVGNTFDYGCDIAKYELPIQSKEKIVIEFADQQVIIYPDSVLKEIK
jgi:hypothetical protein